jgi:hypothetical protein
MTMFRNLCQHYTLFGGDDILPSRFPSMQERIMQKSVLLCALQQEIRRHDLNYFVDEPPSIAQGGKGVVYTKRSDL